MFVSQVSARNIQVLALFPHNQHWQDRWHVSLTHSKFGLSFFISFLQQNFVGLCLGRSVYSNKNQLKNNKEEITNNGGYRHVETSRNCWPLFNKPLSSITAILVLLDYAMSKFMIENELKHQIAPSFISR